MYFQESANKAGVLSSKVWTIWNHRSVYCTTKRLRTSFRWSVWSRSSKLHTSRACCVCSAC